MGTSWAPGLPSPAHPWAAIPTASSSLASDPRYASPEQAFSLPSVRGAWSAPISIPQPWADPAQAQAPAPTPRGTGAGQGSDVLGEQSEFSASRDRLCSQERRKRWGRHHRSHGKTHRHQRVTLAWPQHPALPDPAACPAPAPPTSAAPLCPPTPEKKQPAGF